MKPRRNPIKRLPESPRYNFAGGKLKIKNPNIVKIFDDLEEFKDFCRYSFAYGYEGLVFNEKDLYDSKSRAWTQFLNFKKYGPRKFRKPRFNKPWKKGKNFRKK